jgi:uncharacterized membrane protein
MYTVAKFVHIFGVVLLLGNFIVTALWKTRADRTGTPTAIAFAQRAVVQADRAFTVPGILLILVGGYAMALRRPFPLHGLPWLDWGQGLFYAAVLIWLGLMVPSQRRLVELTAGGHAPDLGGSEFRRVSRRWAMGGGIATLLLVVVLYLMVTKP